MTTKFTRRPGTPTTLTIGLPPINSVILASALAAASRAWALVSAGTLILPRSLPLIWTGVADGLDSVGHPDFDRLARVVAAMIHGVELSLNFAE